MREVVKERVENRYIEVPQIYFVEKFVEVPQEVPEEKIVTVVKPVKKEVIKYVKKPVFVDKVVEVPEIKASSPLLSRVTDCRSYTYIVMSI